MKTIIDLLQGIFFLCASFWCFFYYTGRLNYLGDKEKERAERVKKYGGRLIYLRGYNLYLWCWSTCNCTKKISIRVILPSETRESAL